MSNSTKEEYEKCVKDTVYFLTHYCGCVQKDNGDVVMPINFTKEEIEYIRNDKVWDGGNIQRRRR